MAKLTTTPIASGYASTAALNDNFDLIETALENTLSRDGTTPNHMISVLDMNGFNIINQGNPIEVSGLVWEGSWTTTQAYSIGDIVEYSGASYICIVAHTSSVFATDLGDLKWQLMASGNLPTQTGQATKFLQTNGVVASWVIPKASEVSFTPLGISAVTRLVQNKMEERVSVFDFMTTAQIADVQAGSGSIDVTVAIQKALDASLHIYFPPGRYLVSATLVGRPSHTLIGDNPEITIIQRLANYGDTFAIGSTSPGLGALDMCIYGLWFYKPQEYTAGVTTTITYPVVANASHISAVVASGGIIENCWFYGMPFGITFQQSSLVNIKHCQFSGIWDPKIIGLQEGIASIFLSSSGGSYNVLMTIEDSYINGGYKSAARNVVIGATTLVQTEDIGPKYGVLCEACEGLVLTGNYFGGQSIYSVMLDRKNILAGVKATNNFFDPAGDTCIYLDTTSVDAIVGFEVTGNNFNGQLAGLTAINIDNVAGALALVGGLISNNIFENFLKVPIVVLGGKGIKISDNVIFAYNIAAGGSTADYASGIYIGSISKDTHTSGNLYGGAANTMGTTNNCKWGVYFSATDKGSASNEREISLGLAGGALVAGVEQSYPTTKTMTAVTFENSWVNFSVGAQQASYFKDDQGVVHLQGLVKSGVVGGNIFTLPTGFRPAAQVTFSTISNGAFAYGNINTTGAVIAVTGSNVSWSLDTISFKAT